MFSTGNLSFKETIIHKVVAFDPGERQGKFWIAELLNRFGSKEEPRRAAFPKAPGARGFPPSPACCRW